jgi:hypothetical protein
VRLSESGRLVNRLAANAANGPRTSAGATFAAAGANETPAAALILCPSGGAATVEALDARIGPVAQWSELAAHNRLVAGSSPAGPTTHSRPIGDFLAHDEKRRSGGMPARSQRAGDGSPEVGWPFRRFVSGRKIPFPGNGDHRGQRLGSNAALTVKEGQASGADETIQPANRRDEQPPCREEAGPQ